MKPRHLIRLTDNMRDIETLSELFKLKTGAKRGRRAQNIQVIHKSAIVLLVACWEAYVEDLLKMSFKYFVRHCTDPSRVSNGVRKEILKSIGQRTWDLAGNGWKRVLRNRSLDILKCVDRMDTPTAKNVDNLFSHLLGIAKISNDWRWGRVKTKTVRANLRGLLRRRHGIAHSVATKLPVSKNYVEKNTNMIWKLGELFSNAVATHIRLVIGKFPWDLVRWSR